MIEEIKLNEKLYAIIIRANYSVDGTTFFTDDDSSQQLGFMKYKSGHKIIPHTHNEVPRNIKSTQEVLFIRKGKLRVDFYDNSQNYIESHMLHSGDVIFLSDGGHGFEVIEEIEMIEVKQGPYVGEKDKTRFNSNDKIILKD